MESDIEAGHGRTRQRSGQLVELLEHSGDPVEVVLSTMAANALGGETLESRPQTIDFVDAVKVKLRHRCPSVPLHLHQAFLGEQHQCFAHRTATDVQVGRQLFLYEALPEVDPTSKNRITDCVRHLVGQHAPARRADRGAVMAKIGHVSLSKLRS
jgi:hypothetical protein